MSVSEKFGTVLGTLSCEAVLVKQSGHVLAKSKVKTWQHHTVSLNGHINITIHSFTVDISRLFCDFIVLIAALSPVGRELSGGRKPGGGRAATGLR